VSIDREGVDLLVFAELEVFIEELVAQIRFHRIIASSSLFSEESKGRYLCKCQKSVCQVLFWVILGDFG
jgi:hypothetical protein